ncbi:MAG: hypothetical protein RPU35_10215 [Candidatus Sedimenticola sp. (ex Thyasira tokunagai)]
MYRLSILLKRPVDEGPVLTIFLDGLNQESSAPWLDFLKVLQDEPFAGRVRVVISTRIHHFNNFLGQFRSLIMPAVPVTVGLYDTNPGGELEQMLQFEGLKKADLHPDLVEMAQTPRLFKLVVQLRDNLVNAGKVTIHRLLWEYGRDSLGERAGKSFSEAEWRSWLQEIATKYREGVREYSVKSLSETTNRPDLTKNQVYARLSDIIDGRFAKTDDFGELRLTPTVVAHALGTGLLAHLEKVSDQTFQYLDNELTQWIDPITGFDQRAEILRAAVSILVERDDSAKTSPIAGVLVTAWLQTQNITDEHRQELSTLADNLTNPLLDAVENSVSYTHTSARLWAVNALRCIPRSDESALSIIINRLRQWFCIISREVSTRADANSEFDKRRSERFKERVGSDDSGAITIIGVECELVTHLDSTLHTVAPSIIDGFPLIKTIPILEAAAITLAVRGRNEAWNGLKWLCLLNEVDSEEMAIALRQLSDAVLLRNLEPGISQNVKTATAKYLLSLSGYKVDEDNASLITSGFERDLTYEDDYLVNPARSFFMLERRHAELVLNDTETPLRARISRTKELWLDPNFHPPEAFITEVQLAAADFNVENLSKTRTHTIEDLCFEEFEPIFARCAPDILTTLIHRKIQSITSAAPESRYWNALQIPKYFLLSGEDEANSARILRQQNTETDESDETFASSELLIIELKDKDTLTQIDTLIGANLKYITTNFGEILRPPTPDNVDTLIARYSNGSSKQLSDLLILLSFNPIEFSESSWRWIEEYTKDESYESRGVSFKTLNNADAVRFGQTLINEDWHWSSGNDFWVNHYGSDSLMKATLDIPFDQIAPKLAPWMLLKTVQFRGDDPSEVQLAAEILSHILTETNIDEPDPGSTLTVDQTEEHYSPLIFSAKPYPENNDSESPFEALIDPDAQLIAYRRAIETAVSRINESRNSGASLYLTAINSEEFYPVLRHSMNLVDMWLEGSQELTKQFKRRVHLAEGVFLGLCEALLNHSPARGVQLWHALNSAMRTNYIGIAGINRLLHIVFQVTDSPEIDELRNELISLKHCNTDNDLFDIAIVATCNGKSDWLTERIKRDNSSSLLWRNKRGKILTAFVSNNELPIEDAWPEIEIKTNYAELNRKTAQYRWNEACAHHWWLSYLNASNQTEAYSAWILFLRSADHRAWTWMKKDIFAMNDNSDLQKLKMRHVQLNKSVLKRAMLKRIEKLDKRYLNNEIFEGIGPWC